MSYQVADYSYRDLEGTVDPRAAGGDVAGDSSAWGRTQRASGRRSCRRFSRQMPTGGLTDLDLAQLSMAEAASLGRDYVAEERAAAEERRRREEDEQSDTTSSPASSASASSSSSTRVKKSVQQYEYYLQMAQGEDFTAMEELNVLYVSGKDPMGRPVVVFIASRLPQGRFDLDTMLLYVIKFMDPIVENDYVLIFVNTHLSSANRPSLSWLRRAYTIFNRKYKKNLKSLYIVHPNFWSKLAVRVLKPLTSGKFSKKLYNVTDIVDLYRFVDRAELDLPDDVLHYKSSRRPVFGVPLEDALNARHSKSNIPVVIEDAVPVLRAKFLCVEGLFRLSGSRTQIDELKRAYNSGEEVDLNEVRDPHVVAGLLKAFVREMPEPLFTFSLYDKFMAAEQHLKDEQKWSVTVHALMKKLPPTNKKILRHLFVLLRQVNAHADENMMTSRNLAIVFGPNVLRDNTEDTAAVVLDAAKVNSIMRKMIDHYATLESALEE
jgi:Rho GTPase-activating protein 1